MSRSVFPLAHAIAGVGLALWPNKRVVFYEDSVEPDPRQAELHRCGYLESMPGFIPAL